MKLEINDFLNIIKREVNYRKTNGYYLSLLIDTNFVDDIVYHLDHYIKVLSDQLQTDDEYLLDWLVNEWLPENGHLLKHRIVSAFDRQSKEGLFTVDLKETIVEFDSVGIEKPSKLLIDEINNTTEYFCTETHIGHYDDACLIEFYLPNNVLKNVVLEYKQRGN